MSNIDDSMALLTAWIPRHNGARKRCKCDHHERLTSEQRDYLHRAILWLAEHWTPNPSMMLATFRIAHELRISNKAVVRAMGGFEHHDVPAIREWLIARGAPMAAGEP